MGNYSKKYLSHIYLTVLILGMSGSALYAQEEFQEARMQMMDEIQEMVRDTREYLGKSSLNERVIQVIAKVPRHEFVPASLRPAAYENRDKLDRKSTRLNSSH